MTDLRGPAGDGDHGPFGSDSEDEHVADRWRRGVARRARRIYESAHGNPISDEAKGMRWALDPRVAVALAVILLAVGGVVLWSMRTPSGAEVGTMGGDLPGSGTASPSASPDSEADAWTSDGDVVVHVAGHVARPGLQVLPGGSRVNDAIEAGGGFLADASQDDLNLARVLVDGEQVYVPGLDNPDAPGGESGDSAVEGLGDSEDDRGVGGHKTKINVNRADAQQLEELPGVGPVLAERIEQYRESNGPFIVLDDLQKVSGIGPSLMGKLAEVATV